MLGAVAPKPKPEPLLSPGGEPAPPNPERAAPPKTRLVLKPALGSSASVPTAIIPRPRNFLAAPKILAPALATPLPTGFESPVSAFANCVNAQAAEALLVTKLAKWLVAEERSLLASTKPCASGF